MPHNIQAVLFDLGNTLMYPHAPWPPIFDQAGKAMGEYLRSRKIDVDSASFSDEFLRRLNQYYAERERSMIETSSLAILKDMLTEQGHANLPQELLRAALDNYYLVTQQNWLLENDTIPTLVTLRSEAFHVGLVSNASDSRDVLTLLRRSYSLAILTDGYLPAQRLKIRALGIARYLKCILYTEHLGRPFWKPSPVGFVRVLDALRVEPHQAAYVADNPAKDFIAPNQLGMRSIQVARPLRLHSQAPLEASAAASHAVDSLSHLPALLQSLD
jgi:FMN phosphatase YigB (HAD superfamily)